MELSRLRVFQYRNFDEQEILLSRHTNLFVGLNGQGKTNLLEAIHLLAYGKSFRTAKAGECVQHGRESCSVGGAVEHEGSSRSLQVVISPREKKLLVHGKNVGLEEFIGNLHVLAFTNEHLNIVRGGPAHRRAFLDRAMLALFPGHLHHLAAFGRALKQRNSCLSASLRENRTPDADELDAWDEAIVREGSRVLWNRTRHVKDLKAALPDRIFSGELLKIHYLATVPGEHESADSIAGSYRERLRTARTADCRLGFTTVGPHRDELKVYVDGRALAEYGSAGQQRSALLSLYFAQMEIHCRTKGFYPVFLVDDVEAELDDRRLRTFLDYLAARTQVFLTTAKESFLPPIPDETRRFEVRGGRID